MANETLRPTLDPIPGAAPGAAGDPAPFPSRPHPIEKEWIDYNGHLNMAYYAVLFDRSVDDFFEALGMGKQYAATRRLTTYSAELHICYVRELHLGHTVVCNARLLDYDGKCIRVFQEMRHEDGWLAATAETLTLHVDMNGPKVVPFPPDVLARIEAMHARHAHLPVPERAGRAIGIRRKTPA
ncbi:MAG: thioesterase [Hyphomicrobiales bacterium]|nr:MAG: thioesterase [Hyphomicrobiales bacterium]